MDLTRSAHAAAATPAQSVSQPESDMRNDLRHLNSAMPDRIAAAPGEARHKSSGYGMPCAKCHLYYAANLDVCPTCNTRERVSANVVPAIAKSQAAAEPVPDNAVVEKEREAFLKEFKSQLFAAHAEVANSPVVCTLGENHVQGSEAASICKPCYDRLQERVDVCEAALHMDVKDAAQIVYDAVWSDPSDPSKTYTNAASALLTELRKRAGVSSMIGPFQPLGN
ncbi:MAG: hypothetical protein WCA49_22285 [Candidatus Sulfotelmatobacter sp.]